jgi:hypothetical protein
VILQTSTMNQTLQQKLLFFSSGWTCLWLLLVALLLSSQTNVPWIDASSSSSSTTTTTTTTTTTMKTNPNNHKFVPLVPSRQRNVQEGNTSNNIPEWTEPTYPPTTTVSDDEICTIILSLTYQSSYEEEQNPCTCSRASTMSSTIVNGMNVTVPGSFNIICPYSYCTECYTATATATATATTNGGNSYCGTLLTNYSYFENEVYPKNPIPMDGYECITLSMNNDTSNTDQLCLRTYVNISDMSVTTTTTGSTTATEITTRQEQEPPTPQFYCQIYMNDIMCQSCEFVLCESYPNRPFAQQISFDCSNIENGYSRNTCDYLEDNENNEEEDQNSLLLNETMLSDVLLYLDPVYNPYTFENCKKSSMATPTAPTAPTTVTAPVGSSSVSSPVSSPSRAIPTNTTTSSSTSSLSYFLWYPMTVLSSLWMMTMMMIF